jgi:hypothetical protein
MGQTLTRRRVIYLDRENPLSIVRRNFTELGITDTDTLSVWGGWNSSPAPGPDDPRFEEFVSLHRPLLIFDPLIGFNPGEEQSATETREFMDHFRRLADLGATIILIHHSGKTSTSKEYRGSSDFKAAVDAAYTVDPTEREGKLYRLKLTCFKSRFAPRTDFGLEFQSGEGFAPFSLAQGKDPKDIRPVLARLIGEHPGITQKDIITLAKAEGISKNAVRKCLAESGLWSVAQGKGKALHYSLLEAVPPMEEPPGFRGKLQ